MSTVRQGVSLVVNNLYRVHGEVSASALVEEASDPASPAHAGFEWDDSKAADQHRLWQAREWLRKVTIEIDDREERLVNVRIVNATEGTYKPISVVAANEDEFAAALRFAKAELAAAHTAIAELETAAERVNRTPVKNYRRASRAVEVAQRALG